MEILVAGAASAATPIPVDAMSDAHHAPQPLQIDMEQIAHVGPFVALDRRGRVEQREAIQLGAGEDGVTVDRGRRNAVPICQAVRRRRRSATMARSSAGAVRRGC